MKRERIVVLAKGKAADIPLYRSWSDALAGNITFVSDFDIRWQPPDDTALIVTANQYEEPEALLLREAMRHDIPVLIIADGIIEFRNTWLNPGIIPGSLFQPVAGHKIAVLGNAQARILDTWGNAGVCEVVGSPRLDPLLPPATPPAPPRESARFLVTTARTPGFTDDQVAAVQRALGDLQEWFKAHPQLDGRPVEVTWRLTAGLDDALAIDPAMRGNPADALTDLLPAYDALITTPSTTMLEGMLCGIPVAMLDYTNSPTYLPPAWSITAAVHLDSIIPELLNPPEAKRHFQTMTLHDALACTSPATPRMLHLVREMVRIGNACRDAGDPLTFPAHILPHDDTAAPAAADTFDLATLYPGRLPPTNHAPADLQAENGHLLRLARQQQTYINDLIVHIGEINGKIQATSPLYAKLLRMFSHPTRPTLEPLEDR